MELHLLFLSLLLLQRSIPGASRKWLTLDGKEPLVVANGGNSGLYPHSSGDAFGDAKERSSPNSLLLCDMRLMKDETGVCLPSLNMEIGTDISYYYPHNATTKMVNGVEEKGWFTVDYTYDDTYYFNLTQMNPLRSQRFNGLYFIVRDVDLQQLEKPRLWLNVEHDKFYTDNNLNMTKHLLNLTNSFPVDFVSSPELSFLSRIAPSLHQSSTTQIVFKFLEREEKEPSTGLTYGSLLNNLTSIRELSSGIILPKSYIWPVDDNLELASRSSFVVEEAHKAGLKVFASGFGNDFPFAYNYSFDPSKEYLSFIDNGGFSVDGFLTDSPITASATIGCLAGRNSSGPSSPGKPTIISYGGAGGIYPSCTDIAYERAIEDGADYVDCPVQLTKDGTLACLIDIDLSIGTTIAASPLSSLSSTIPAIKTSAGIYSFNLTWQEIQKTLKPEISSPFLEYFNLTRNPREKNAGSFLSLTQFLDFAKEKPPRSGILISIEHAPFLRENLGFDLIGEVLKTLNESNIKLDVIFQSSNSSVLKRIKREMPSSSAFKLMYKIEELIRDIEEGAAMEIASFAELVAVQKRSVYFDRNQYLLNKTRVLEKLKKENLSVFAYTFRNEFPELWWDCYNDPFAEINTFVHDAGVDGFISEFPSTVDAFRRSSCGGGGGSVPYWAPIKLDNLGVNVSALNPPLEAAPPLAAVNVAEPPM